MADCDCSHADPAPSWIFGFCTAGLALAMVYHLFLDRRGVDRRVLRHRVLPPGEGDTPGHGRFQFERLGDGEVAARASEFAAALETRRSVRFFSDDPVPAAVVRDIVRAAASAPSGAHQQPWTYVAVRSADVKAELRAIVEEEERKNYGSETDGGRMGAKWRADVDGIVADLHQGGEVEKPYLTDAPWVVAVMLQTRAADGGKHHYPTESVGISAGMLIAAVHAAGLATLTSTPLGAGTRIRELLGRPANERVFLLMPIGFPAEDGCTVPYRPRGSERKPIDETFVVVG